LPPSANCHLYSLPEALLYYLRARSLHWPSQYVLALVFRFEPNFLPLHERESFGVLRHEDILLQSTLPQCLPNALPLKKRRKGEKNP